MTDNGFLPLRGKRVVDVTTSLAGPYCTEILGALGADVIKVERPDTGDEARHWGPPFWDGEGVLYLAANASKRSLALDVKSEQGQEVRPWIFFGQCQVKPQSDGLAFQRVASGITNPPI